MRTTAQVPKLSTSYSDDLRSDPVLFKIIETANQYLLEEYSIMPASQDVVQSSVHWTKSTLDGVTVLIPELKEINREGNLSSTRDTIPLSEARDINSLKIEMILLLLGISRQRYEKVNARWDKLLDIMEEQEAII